MHSESIESIILSNDLRSISILRQHLPENYCQRAAKVLHDHPGPVMIVTGFYISSLSLTETDGPPGALAVGRALQRMGRSITYVTDQYSLDLMQRFAQRGSSVVSFPITSPEESLEEARRLIAQFDPSVMISIERCGRTKDGRYINCRGVDLTMYNARLDTLFDFGIPSIAVGDGGNEIGMGNLAEWIPGVPSLPLEPAITRVDALIIASVSNWGAYGLVSALSALTHQDLLPDAKTETRLIKDMITFGACDGAVLQRTNSVDGFSLEDNEKILNRLQQWLVEDPH